MAHQNTTIIFVPGAWHSPDSYNGVISHLHSAGYKTSKVWTPSVLRNGATPLQSFDEDVTEIRKHLKEATDAGQKVALVMHSYAGMPGSQAVEGFDQASMATQGHRDGRGVVHLFYLAAFMLRHGESTATVAPSGPPPSWLEFRADGTSVVQDPVKAFYNDFESKEEIDRLIADLNPWSFMAGSSPVSHEPWKTVPATYISCELDNAISASRQRTFVRNAIEAGAVDMRVIHWNCGHTPHGRRPQDVSLLIRRAVEDVANLVPEEGKTPVAIAVNAVASEVQA